MFVHVLIPACLENGSPNMTTLENITNRRNSRTKVDKPSNRYPKLEIYFNVKSVTSSVWFKIKLGTQLSHRSRICKLVRPARYGSLKAVCYPFSQKRHFLHLRHSKIIYLLCPEYSVRLLINPHCCSRENNNKSSLLVYY